MDVRRIVLEVEEYSSLQELTAPDQELVEQAVLVRSLAYAPYSNFKVGAAARLENGVVITGNNQENAAYPAGLCAERVAMFHAQSLYPDIPIEAIAISAASEDFKLTDPVSPCGSCRQVMAEYENRHHNRIKVIMAGTDKKFRIVNGIENLLPLKFILEQLKKTSKKKV